MLFFGAKSCILCAFGSKFCFVVVRFGDPFGAKVCVFFFFAFGALLLACFGAKMLDFLGHLEHQISFFFFFFLFCVF